MPVGHPLSSLKIVGSSGHYEANGPNTSIPHVSGSLEFRTGDHHLLGFEFFGDCDQVGQLGAAESAPGGPHVEHDHLFADVICQPDALAAEAFPRSGSQKKKVVSKSRGRSMKRPPHSG
jgi:hypothetical protein